MESPESYLERAELRNMITELIEGICRERPNRLAPYAANWLLKRGAITDERVCKMTSSLGDWTSCSSVQLTSKGMLAYLTSMDVGPTLEHILEKLLNEQPQNPIEHMVQLLCQPIEGSSARQDVVAKHISSTAGTADTAEQLAEPLKSTSAAPSRENLDAFFEAIANGEVEAMAAKLDSGVPISATTDDGSTGLHIAAEGESGCVEELLRRRCPVDALGGPEVQRTALGVAVLYEDLAIVNLLLKAGASTNIPDSYGKTVLDYAQSCSDLDIKAALGAASSAPPAAPTRRPKGRRGSISSESIDARAGLDLSSIPFVPKSAEAKVRIKECVQDSILFQSLDEKTLEAVIMSMHGRQVQSGEALIKQGDDGDFFYVVDSGAFDCFVKDKEDAAEGLGALVTQYGPKTTFGELALMYNAPRAASIIATADSTVWAMERNTFRKVLVAHTSTTLLQKQSNHCVQ
uniref:Cyclic nucleotide-binding domain-containing protein n=1 Tax=Chrysotila carterae TaxID=13221 RepID=A0A7S4ETX5_CHRCT